MWSPSWVKTELEKMGRAADRRLGQHFLVDKRVAERQLEYAGLNEQDTVLEIGPGLGALTQMMAERAGRIIAIEWDAKLASRLQNAMPDNVEVTHGDAMRVEFPKFNKVVSNLPYEISSPITFKLLERKFDLAVLMYQLEFAERMVARPGSKHYSRLSVNTAYRADCEILEKVPPSAYFPRPKVSSAVVKLTPRPPPVEVVNEELFFMVVNALFQHRRKKIKNSVEMAAGKMGVKGTDALTDLPHASERVETLSIEDIAEISDHLAHFIS